jgi:hypothetical protein
MAAVLRIQHGLHAHSGLLRYISGDYAVKRDNWNGVKLEIYYLKSFTPATWIR